MRRQRLTFLEESLVQVTREQEHRGRRANIDIDAIGIQNTDECNDCLLVYAFEEWKKRARKDYGRDGLKE